MLANVVSFVQQYNAGAYLCEEKCRFCRTPVVVPHGDVQVGRLKCLCEKCGSLLKQNRQALWWLPMNSGRTACAPTGFREPRKNPGTIRGGMRLMPVMTAGMYEGPLQKLIRRLKYDEDQLTVGDIAPFMVNAFALFRADVLPIDADPIVISVPLHNDRQRKRGYNQAQLLAQQFAKLAGLEAGDDILRRSRNTRPQFGLRKPERLENVQGAFVPGAKPANGRTIIIIDDVFTSGATMTECASSLIAAGARTVAGLAAARAPLHKRI